MDCWVSISWEMIECWAAAGRDAERQRVRIPAETAVILPGFIGISIYENRALDQIKKCQYINEDHHFLNANFFGRNMQIDSQGHTPGIKPVPWDARDQIGLFPALWKTILMVLCQPDQFFRNLQVQNSVSSPRNFFILVQFISFCVLSCIRFLFAPPDTPMMYLIMLAIFVPVIMLSLLLISAVMHVFVMLVGGKKRFIGTFHVMAYSSVTGFLQVIPRIGVLVSLIWGIYVGIIGLRRVHGLTVPRAVIAYAMPSVLALSLMLASIWAPRHYRFRDADKNDQHMQLTLKRISTSLENYAEQHGGRYPPSLDHLKANPPILQEAYCGANTGGFLVSCRLAEDGYVLTATPIIVEKTGTTTFTVTTGGVTVPQF